MYDWNHEAVPPRIVDCPPSFAAGDAGRVSKRNFESSRAADDDHRFAASALEF
jgi:hypothetical protein